MSKCLWLLAALALGACAKTDSNGPANHTAVARVLLTDDPLPYDSLNAVEVYIVSIAASTSADTNDATWVTIAEPRRRVNLLELQQGTTTLLGEHELPADEYRAVRMVINTDSSAIIYDFRPADVDWNGAGEQTLHALVEAPVTVAEEGADIVIDFDLGRSFHYLYGTSGWGFSFVPWIRAVNKAATGSIAGTVTADSLPWEHAVVTVIHDFQTYSTGHTDSIGHYRIAYLLPGEYIVVTEPPASINGGYGSARPDTSYNITIAQGVETMHSVTLFPW